MAKQKPTPPPWLAARKQAKARKRAMRTEQQQRESELIARKEQHDLVNAELKRMLKEMNDMQLWNHAVGVLGGKALMQLKSKGIRPEYLGWGTYRLLERITLEQILLRKESEESGQR